MGSVSVDVSRVYSAVRWVEWVQTWLSASLFEHIAVTLVWSVYVELPSSSKE